MDFGNCVVFSNENDGERTSAINWEPVRAPPQCAPKYYYFSDVNNIIYDHELTSENTYHNDGSLLISRHRLHRSHYYWPWDSEAHLRGRLASTDTWASDEQRLAAATSNAERKNNSAGNNGIVVEDQINSTRSIISNKTGATNTEERQQVVTIVTLLLFVLLYNQNALPCYGLGDTEFVDDSSLFGHTTNFERSPSLNSMRRFQNNPNQRLPQSHPTDSLYQNPSPQGHQPNSWTSMLTNPFNGPKDDLDLHIRQILIPRVSGTQGNIQVREYIVRTLKNLNYHVDLDEFVDQTPIGDVKFANIIASSNPNACRQLVLACHHDSKMMDGFLGATDSAVPCAMLLKMADTFRNLFRSSSNDAAGEKGSLGLRFVFFDGEEAYVKWGPKDSLYGSRHLAAKWEKQAAPSNCGHKNELGRIEMLMVLDLIGTSDTSFVNYNLRLKSQYNRLQKIEAQHLSSNGLTSSQIRKEASFRNRYIPLDFLEDDHVPFHKRGVPVLSLLAHPFPEVWHTIEDNYTAIDFPRTRRILHILEQFVTNYTSEIN